eukprot:COSAG05_NODE_204_length_14187_cov_99.887422_11_plen_115_part_00
MITANLLGIPSGAAAAYSSSLREKRFPSRPGRLNPAQNDGSASFVMQMPVLRDITNTRIRIERRNVSSLYGKSQSFRNIADAHDLELQWVEVVPASCHVFSVTSLPACPCALKT